MLVDIRSGRTEPTFLFPLRDEVFSKCPLNRLFQQAPVEKRPDGWCKGAVFARPDVSKEIAFVMKVASGGGVSQGGGSKNEFARSSDDRGNVRRVKHTD